MDKLFDRWNTLKMKDKLLSKFVDEIVNSKGDTCKYADIIVRIETLAKKEIFSDIEKSKVIYDLPLNKSIYTFLNSNRYKKIKKTHLK